MEWPIHPKQMLITDGPKWDSNDQSLTIPRRDGVSKTIFSGNRLTLEKP